MRRPVVTAVLLDELRKAGEPIRLAKNSLITPAARDWLKEHLLPITWEEPNKSAGGQLGVVMDASLPEMRSVRSMLDRLGVLADVIEPVGGRTGIAAATRRLCGKVFRKEVAKGVVFAQDGAMPVCVANKHVGIRAALGTSVPGVEEACRQLGINLLVIEQTSQSVFQIKQMIERFAKGPTAAQPETAATIEIIEQGGGRADW